MCRESYDGQHDYEAVDDWPDPEFPDDEDSYLVLWCCTLCGRVQKTHSWEGAPS